jgi:8-oxo-dGTP diphosphatase
MPVGSALTGLAAKESRTVPVFVDTVAWVHLENGRILCARPRGKDIFYIPGGKREGAETDVQTLLRDARGHL